MGMDMTEAMADPVTAAPALAARLLSLNSTRPGGVLGRALPS